MNGACYGMEGTSDKFIRDLETAVGLAGQHYNLLLRAVYLISPFKKLNLSLQNGDPSLITHYMKVMP